MKTIHIEGRAGKVNYIPSNVSKGVISKVEADLRKAVSAHTDYMNASEIKSILKQRNPLVGTPGGALKAYRLREDMTQREFAKKAKIEQSHLSEMENNQRPIGMKMAKKLAKILNCDYRRLLTVLHKL